MNIFNRFKQSLEKTRQNLHNSVSGLFSRHGGLTEEMLEELEDILIGADIGVTTTMKLVDTLREKNRRQRMKTDEEIVEVLQEEIEKMITNGTNGEEPVKQEQPLLINLIVGVNGVGKTTSIAKLAHMHKQMGKKVMLAAADTFRAAAIDQLLIWGERLNLPVVHHKEGGDPAAVVYDSIESAKAKKMDVLIVDTAGRLHTKVNLMEELKKMKRVIQREQETTGCETLLVLDATTGQNGIAQAKMFHEAVDVDGIVLTKLDGTAKGGIVVAVKDSLGIPIRYVGTGESLEDISAFDPKAFAQALFSV